MKMIIIEIFVFCFCNIGFAQSPKIVNGEQIRIEYLVGKWIMTTISNPDSNVSVPASEANYLNFKIDGSYSDSSSKFKISHGIWTYDSSTQILYTNEIGGKSSLKILKLTKTELVYSVHEPNIFITTHYHKLIK